MAEVVGTRHRTPQRSVAWYREGGPAAVRTYRKGGHGQTAWLTAAHQEQLAQEVATGRLRNTAAIGA